MGQSVRTKSSTTACLPGSANGLIDLPFRSSADIICAIPGNAVPAHSKIQNTHANKFAPGVKYFGMSKAANHLRAASFDSTLFSVFGWQRSTWRTHLSVVTGFSQNTI